jgi:hypothetical protein
MRILLVDRDDIVTIVEGLSYDEEYLEMNCMNKAIQSITMLQKILSDNPEFTNETVGEGILFSSAKTIQEVIEDLEQLSIDAEKISKNPGRTDQSYYHGISVGVKWSINRVKNIETKQAMKPYIKKPKGKSNATV